MGKRANIRAIRAATETAVWQKQAQELRAQGAIPTHAGPREAQRFSQAAASHNNRFALMWVWFAVTAAPAFLIAGAHGWWLVAPLGVLFAAIHITGLTSDAKLTDAQRARRIFQKRLWGTAQWTNGQCTWCGSVVQHRDEHGRLQASQSFHAGEMAAEVDRRMIAQYGTDGRQPE